MTNLWTRSETVGPPSQLVIEYKSTNAQNEAEEKSLTATSTTFGTSTSTYQALVYTDREGKPQTSEVMVRKVDTTRTTIAAVNPGYVAWRLTKKLGLPPGDALSENITTSEYTLTVDGPVLKTETSDQYVSMAQFSGGLQLEEWGNFRPSGGEMVLSHRTIRRMDYSKTSDGRDVTRTRTERYIAAAESSEWKNYAAKRGKDIKALVQQFPETIEPFVRSLIPLVYEGTEVQIETGRIPVPEKPPDQDIAAGEVTDGRELTSDSTPLDAYGNNLGWTSYIPDADTDGNWQNYNTDSNGDGIPDWNDYVPQSWEDYDTDSNNDGTFNWEPYVPQDFTDYDRDTNGDGIPDWAPFVPTEWQDFNTDTDNDGVPDWAPFVPTQWQDFVADSDNNGIPDWAPYVPTGWEDFNQDTDGNGIPDWAPYVPGNWQDFNQDTNNDGIPDWAPFVPQTWEDYNQDTNGDGVPDWAPFVPTTWEDYNQDSDNDGIPDWQPYVPKDWTDYNIDSDGDGIPDWAPYVPTGTDFDTDTDGDGVPDWAPYVPTGPDDFDTSDSDFTTTETEVSNEKFITGVVLFNGQAFDPDNTTVTATYDMPFAPDDYFEYVKGIRKLIPGGALTAAQAFGRTESALDVGHAYGQNIVTGWNETPTLDLSPVYVQLAGIEGAFLMDSCSYAWGPEGMVVSSDLMLLGVSGWYGSSQPTTSWVRLPVPPTGLQQVPAGTVGFAVKANSIPIPGGFSGRTPGPVLSVLPSNGSDTYGTFRTEQQLVTPTLELEQIRLATGPLLIAREFNYELTVEPEAAAIATGPVLGVPAPIPLASIVYSQSSIYSSNTAATVTNMQDEETGGTATGTNDGALEWIAMDLGAIYAINRIVIGTATATMTGGWTKAATQNRDIQHSLNGTTWAVGGNTGTFAAEGVYELAVNFTARYVRIVAENDYLGLSELYPLAIDQVKISDSNLSTGPYIAGVVFVPGEPIVISGTAAPVLGAARVNPASIATDDGWTLAFDDSADEDDTETDDFGFSFTLNSIAYSTCYATSNGYITFGASSVVYANLGAAVPAVPKLHFNSTDGSYQRIYTKAETGLFRIRWEGSASYNAGPGGSTRFVEATFYAPLSNGSQLLEVRSGDTAGGVGGPFMLASATSAYATAAFAANQSWIFTGNATGTAWSVQSEAHAEILEI